MTVYLVDGYIEDGMQGIPIILGVFSCRTLAERAIINYIDGAMCIISKDGKYNIEDVKRNMTYCLSIAKYELDRVTRPSY
jgi:hypothetical protein